MGKQGVGGSPALSAARPHPRRPSMTSLKGRVAAVLLPAVLTLWPLAGTALAQQQCGQSRNTGQQMGPPQGFGMQSQTSFSRMPPQQLQMIALLQQQQQLIA